MKMRKKIHKLSTFLLSGLVMLTVLSPFPVKAAEELPFMVDNAGLLSTEDAASIE